jgi:Fe2+ transport system protein FeoA
MLSELEVGSTGIIESVNLPPGVHNHLMYMGFLPNARVQVLHRAPAGDPTVYAIDGLEIALRRETAQAIQVRSTRSTQPAARLPRTRRSLSKDAE